MFRKLSEAICHLASAINASREQGEKEFCWFKSTAGLVTKQDLAEMEGRIMATQAEVVAELQVLKGQAVKIKQEVVDAKNELQETIKKLEAIIAAGNTGDATAELIAIKDELKAELQTIDDLHLDKPVEPPPVA